MSKRRGRNEGSVFKRQNGTWAAILSLGVDGTGRRRRRHVYGRDKTAVLEKLARLRSQALDGTLGDAQRVTVDAYLTRWLEDTARPAVSDATYTLYELIIRLHLTPHIGGVVLSKLAPAHVSGMLGELERQGASPRLRQIVHAILSRALRQAVRWQMIPRNVCDAVTRPRASRPTMQVLSPAQVTKLLAAAKGERLEALYVLAVTTGLRQGELLGLEWPDVDVAGAALHVRHALHELSGKLWIGEPKTAKARRQVDLPAIAVDALRDHRQRMLAEGHPHGLVFCDTEGGPLRKSNLIHRSFQPVLEKAELPRIRFHDLRHTHATLLLSQGVHPKVVQERLGHSQIALTLDTYSHVLPGMGREAAAKLDALLAPSSHPAPAGKDVGISAAPSS